MGSLVYAKQLRQANENIVAMLSLETMGYFSDKPNSQTAWMSSIGWSDHWSFWQQGYRGIMVTDTATYRYSYYHTGEDTIDKIDFDQ